MGLKQEAQRIIDLLEKEDLYAECSCCGESIPLRRAGLFYLDDFTEQVEELYEQWVENIKDIEKELKEKRKWFSESSETISKSVNIGNILERIAPALEEFSFDKNDCRSLFDPIDYIIFEGLSKKEIVTKLFFVEIKTGGSRLTPVQSEIRRLIEAKKVNWNTY